MSKQTTQPQDHRLPKDAPRHITAAGIEFDIDPQVFDDLDVLEDLYDIQNSGETGDGAFKIVPFLRKILGETTYRRVKDALRDPQTGRIGMDALSDFLTEMMGQASPNS